MLSSLFLQFIHIELLISYSVKDVLTLVKRDPRFTVKLLNELNFEDSVVDEGSHRFIADNVVAWLYERGENPDEFVERIVKRCASFEAVPARSVLRSYLPFVSSFYSTDDVRALCLEIIPKRYPFLKQAAVIKNEVVGEDRDMMFIFRFDTPSALVSNPMRWILGMFRVGPLLLSTPAYEHMSYIASQTSFIETLEKRVNAEIKDDGTVYVNGKLVGKSVTFGECLDARNIKWDNDVERSVGCVLALDDVFDEKTGAHLVQKGCYYGTPANILDVKFKANVKAPEPFLKLMSSVVKQEFAAWAPIQKAQEQLLDAMNDSVTIVYYKSDESISVNNKHLMRNVPARILRNLLREYIATGREEYENREFKRDPAICMDPLRPNFESRLNRVIAHINGSDDPNKPSEGVKKYFEIERHRRGGFRFVPKCKIIFREE
ncbi:hypothetical protein [Fibrobacter sp. UWP2]|jgi:hypothetical protein|uniref:hypothetical protein n=1 Tax=Fibrobacter sp. UWP2 TaxID=1896216 RepID=UPI00092093E6|nr:hypothetical protein [Fibrobacter sp. UWP2]SHI77620.1 hypothetical protein SAMN05720471_10757 [Fibrobacter sp. UWP2]